MKLVEYRGGNSTIANRHLPKIGSVGMVVDGKEDFYLVEFPYQCFDELVEDEELIVALAKNQFVSANQVFLDAVNTWVEKQSKEFFERYVAFMKEYGDDEEKIKELFGEELGGKMLDFYEKEVKNS